MLLNHRFYRLPIIVDAQKIRREIDKINNDQWIDHPNKFNGNNALPLISIDGQDNHDVLGKMQPCPRLEEMPYTKHVLANLNTPLGRCRFMRLDAGSSVPLHCDTNLYWQKRMRVHIPIITNETVMFTSGGQTHNMAAGEAWIVDTWHKHEVKNNGGVRIHLVIDTQGSAEFWSMLNTSAWTPTSCMQQAPSVFLPKKIIKLDNKTETQSLDIEDQSDDTILSPALIKQTINFYLNDLEQPEDSNHMKEVESILHTLLQHWQKVWDNFGINPKYHLSYRLLILHAIEKLNKQPIQARLKTNHQTLSSMLTQFLHGFSEVKIHKQKTTSEQALSIHFDPIFIVAAPRSGSTLLYETLGYHEQLMHYDDESHNIIESIPSLSIDANDSNHLNAEHATKSISQQLKAHFLTRLDPKEISQKKQIKFLEKTPKNALRIDFLNAAFPNARFIYLFRQPHSNISSIIDGWKSGRFVTYPNLASWQGNHPWSFLLPKGWRDLPQNDLGTIANYQYATANQSIIDSLNKLENNKAMALSYEDFIEKPETCLQRICGFLDLPWSDNFEKAINSSNGLAFSKYTLDAPSKDKWRRNKAILEPVLANAQDFYHDKIVPATHSFNCNTEA